MSEFHDKLKSVLDRFDYIHFRLNSIDIDYRSSEYTDLSKELSDISPVCFEIRKLLKYNDEIKSSLGIAAMTDSDPELRAMAENEIETLKVSIENSENRLKILLLPKDIDDEKNAILEIRAGTGGDEAGLFAANLLKMYEMYSNIKTWKFEILNMSENGIGSLKEAVVSISGKGVFARLKYESGVHRVQRVPETEASGRIHTSAATVAVLPEVEDIDISIDENDLLIDTYRASGAGGQHVNKTDSAVRITHIPTGVVVAMQDERSQHRNREKALKILRSKIYENRKIKKENERASERKIQVGSGDRSERIRTYNFSQGRVSDHRINLTLYKIDKIMDGTALDEVIDKLIEFDQAEKLKNSV
ncbi:MAG: peptide chain release factor 1 [Holosporales bacterium]|jgi:peptide chain release factor 1|nr:peptide chain release factor 1 [Holosporales bacterium]